MLTFARRIDLWPLQGSSRWTLLTHSSGSVSSGLRHVPGRHAQSPGEQEVHLYSVLRPVDSLTLPIALVMSGPTSVSVASPQMAS